MPEPDRQATAGSGGRGGQPYDRLAWAVEVLDVAADDGIIELGCGHGVAVSLLRERQDRGRITALDRSPTMVAIARKRNAACAEKARFITAQAASPTARAPDWRGPGRRHHVDPPDVDVVPLAGSRQSVVEDDSGLGKRARLEPEDDTGFHLHLSPPPEESTRLSRAKFEGRRALPLAHSRTALPELAQRRSDETGTAASDQRSEGTHRNDAT